MKKGIIGIILGGLLYFLAGAATWMVFTWHDTVMKKIPEEMLVRDTLNVVVPAAGLYFFPSNLTDNGRMDPKQHMEMMKTGPSGLLFFKPATENCMPASSFVIGILHALVTAAFCWWILFMLRSCVVSYLGRVLTVLGIGVFVWFNSQVPFWNWMFFPGDYILVILLDTVFCFGFMGLVLAKFVPARESL